MITFSSADKNVRNIPLCSLPSSFNCNRDPVGIQQERVCIFVIGFFLWGVYNNFSANI